ncbi:MAG: hypothetical protein AAF484_16250 [Pseudomonadota bacterium]
MIQQTLYLFFLFAIPLFVQFRGWPVSWLFASAALCYVVIAGISFAEIKLILAQIERAEPAYHDTYYVTHAGNYATSFALAMTFFAATSWLQERYAAMRFPKLTKGFFWLLHLAVLGSASAPIWIGRLFMPRRYVDYPEYFQIVNWIATGSAALSLFSCVGLLVLLIWSCVAKWRSR